MSTPSDLPQRYGPPAAGFACFGCWAGVPAGATQCPRCGTVFVGEHPARLWHLEGELKRIDGRRAEVAAEAGRLRSALMARGPVPSSVTAGLPAFPRPAPRDGRGRGAGPADQGGGRQGNGQQWGGQQLLLALGGFLLLSGAAFFLYVAWDLIGLIGQAAVMVVLTLTAAFAARAATVRHLPAAAETAALIASGLLVLDVTAAYSLGLFGVDETDPNLYFGLVGVLAAAVLVGFDLLVPTSGDRDAGREGGRLRPIWSYRPIAAFVASASAWNLLGLLDGFGADLSGAVALSSLLLVIGLAGVGVALLAQVVDRPSRDVAHGALALKASVFAALIPAVPALLGHVLGAVAEGYGPDGTNRVAAFALLAAVPVVSLVVVGMFGRRTWSAGWTRAVVVAAGLGLVLAAGVWLWVTPRGVLLVLAVLAAVVLVATAVLAFVRPDLEGAEMSPGAAFGVTVWGAGGAAVALSAMVLVLDRCRCVTMADLVDLSLRADQGTVAPMAWWMPVLPVALVAVHFALSALRLRSAEAGNSAWVLVAHLASVTALATALRDVPEPDWRLPLLVAGVVVAGLAALRAWGAVAGSAPEAGVTERLHVVVSALLLGVSILIASSVSASTAVVFAVVAALVHLVVAVAPGRVEVGWWTALWVSIAVVAHGVERGYETIEAYTLVPALALAALGLARLFRGRTESSWGVLGFALAVGLVPTLMTMMVVQDATRTALVTGVGLVLLLAGCAGRWAAPVAFGTLALVSVGWLQGDVWAEYVPTWLTLTLAGALLLAVGVGWERAVALGRRGSNWFSSLR